MTRAAARESMKTSIAAKLDQARQRLLDIDALLSSENATRDLDQFRKLSREHADLEPIVELFNRYREAEQHVAEAQELLDDPEMKSYAESEIKGKEDVPGDATCGKLTVVTKGFNQTGATVCTMEYDMLIYKRGYAPFEKANY